LKKRERKRLALRLFFDYFLDGMIFKNLFFLKRKKEQGGHKGERKP